MEELSLTDPRPLIKGFSTAIFYPTSVRIPPEISKLQWHAVSDQRAACRVFRHSSGSSGELHGADRKWSQALATTCFPFTVKRQARSVRRSGFCARAGGRSSSAPQRYSVLDPLRLSTLPRRVCRRR